MHEGEIATNPELVYDLLAAQFPQWAKLPVARVASSGTTYALYRLGDDMVARLPLLAGDDEQLLKECAWLPRIAPLLPLAVPAPLALGEPGAGYPARWVVSRWIAGENATVAETGASVQVAGDLARFILALRQIDASDGPTYGNHNFGRGAPLATRDEEVREALAELATPPSGLDNVALAACAAAWSEALAAPVWDGPPTWIHGDLHPDNLIWSQGRLRGVIDFGGLGVGDPACDLLPAWTLFTGEARSAFRAALEVDEASWARGRGWALSMALIAFPYYLHTNPAMVALSRHMIAEVLTDS
jgi:aminoglycoside phosphotransferase (APT) family kinase protein